MSKIMNMVWKRVYIGIYWSRSHQRVLVHVNIITGAIKRVPWYRRGLDFFIYHSPTYYYAPGYDSRAAFLDDLENGRMSTRRLEDLVRVLDLS